MISLAALTLGQSWQASYEKGLDAISSGRWADARVAMQDALRARGDVSGKTVLPGAITERKVWRNGAPYSPQFLAGYASYKLANLVSGDSRAQLLSDAASNFSALIEEHKASQAAYAMLALVYSLQGDTQKKAQLGERYAAEGAYANFKVDFAALAPEDGGPLSKLVPPPPPNKPVAQLVAPKQEPVSLDVSSSAVPKAEPLAAAPEIRQPAEPAVKEPKPEPSTQSASALPNAGLPADVQPLATASTVSNPVQGQVTGPVQPEVVQVRNPAGQSVAPGSTSQNSGLPDLTLPKQGVANKFALIVGNSLSSMADGEMPFAAEDAMRVKQALVTSAGYPEENVDLVINATAEQLAASINAMAQRVSENATVLIYFSGIGVNVGGKDYLAGVDSEFASDGPRMLSKESIYRAFATKGAVVFSFFQSNRPVLDGRYFGSEVPMVGRVSQVQATIPGSTVRSIFRDGKESGLFTDAFVSVLTRLKNNQIPILEFGWQLFNQIRRGDTGTTGGGSAQTPTLPVLTNLASDARF